MSRTGTLQHGIVLPASRHMPQHQATQLLTETAALHCLQIIHQREDTLALGGVSWDEKRDHYEAQDVGVLIGEVDQHVRPELVERAAAQPEVAVDLHLDVLPLLLHVRELGGLWEQHLVGLEDPHNLESGALAACSGHIAKKRRRALD
jgi:hypothetical protein